MQCPFCGARDTKVLDSRPAEHRIRRRRECIFCGKRFTTYEMVERPLLMVKKRDGSFEPFDRQKLITGIFNAIKKRPVSVEQVAAIAEGIEQHCTSNRCKISDNAATKLRFSSEWVLINNSTMVTPPNARS